MDDGNEDALVIHSRLIDIVVTLEAERNTAVTRCQELQTLVSHLSKKLKVNTAQHAAASLEHMEKFEAAMIEANHAHFSERTRLEDKLADAHAAILTSVRAGSIPGEHDVYGDSSQATDIKFVKLEAETVDRSTSPNMLPSGFSFLGRAGRTMLDEETQTAEQFLMVAQPIVDHRHSEETRTKYTPAWLANTWLRPATVFSPLLHNVSAALQDSRQEDSPSPAANRRASIQNFGRRSSLAALPIEESKPCPSATAVAVPLSQKVLQLVENAKQSAAVGRSKRSATGTENTTDALDAARIEAATAQEALLAERDATIHALLQQLASARLELEVERNQHAATKERSKLSVRRSVSTMTSKRSVVDVAAQSDNALEQIQSNEPCSMRVLDSAVHAPIGPSRREAATEEELMKVQEENIAFQRERVTFLATHKSMLARIAELERRELELQSKKHLADIQTRPGHGEDPAAAQLSLSPRRQSHVLLHDLVKANQTLNEELLLLRSTTSKQRAAALEIGNDRTALAQHNATLEQSLASLRTRLAEHELEQQRSTQTILSLQQHLRERNTEVKVLRQTLDATEHDLLTYRSAAAAREASLCAQILQLSERLRLQTEEWQLNDYRQNRNVVSIAAFQDLTEQVESYQAQERALFEVLSRLIARESGEDKGDRELHTPPRSSGTASSGTDDLLGMVLEWSTRRGASAAS
jgi:hypothetical protein